MRFLSVAKSTCLLLCGFNVYTEETEGRLRSARTRAQNLKNRPGESVRSFAEIIHHANTVMLKPGVVLLHG